MAMDAVMVMDVMRAAAGVMVTDVTPEDVTVLADEMAAAAVSPAVKGASVHTVPPPITSRGVE